MFWRKNQNLYRRGILNLVLLLVIIFTLLIFAVWVGYNMGVNAAEGLTRKSEQSAILPSSGTKPVYLTAISLSENAGLSQASGIAKINQGEGLIEIDVIVPDGKQLPENAVLEGWLVDAGEKGGLGKSSVSAADERYGTPLANPEFSQYLNNSPFPYSLGRLSWRPDRGSFYKFFRADNSYSSYDAVMITLESDGNQGDYDPRPGTPILVGKIE